MLLSPNYHEPICILGARVHDLEDVKSILDVFQAHGHSEVSTPTFHPWFALIETPLKG